MHSPQLTTAELLLIIAALYAVAPTGGGSEQFNLANKLSSQFGLMPDPHSVGALQAEAYDEFNLAHTGD